MTILAVAWVAALVAVCTLSPLPPVVPLVVLSALVLFTEHRHVLFGDGTSMSGSMIIVLAALMIFRDSSPFAGPFIVASMAGAFWPHIRDRRFDLIALNSAAISLPAVLAAQLLETAAPGTLFRIVLGIPAALGAYWTFNNLLITPQVAAHNETPVWSLPPELIRSDLFAPAYSWYAATMLGAFSGTVSEYIIITIASVAIYQRLQYRCIMTAEYLAEIFCFLGATSLFISSGIAASIVSNQYSRSLALLLASIVVVISPQIRPTLRLLWLARPRSAAVLVGSLLAGKSRLIYVVLTAAYLWSLSELSGLLNVVGVSLTMIWVSTAPKVLLALENRLAGPEFLSDSRLGTSITEALQKHVLKNDVSLTHRHEQ